MRFRFLICICLIFLLCSCATVHSGVCRHNALYAAVVMGERYDVRIDFGPSSLNPNIWHAQAKAMIGGEWQWLQVRGNHVWVGRKDEFDPMNSFSVGDFMHVMGIRDKTVGIYGGHQ
ncbi:MAG: hypothetical protein CSYNP_01626 [Syntrophus sp. SKADARSKE-3]|nr:hypothetical protein [Syntrophus sp. SKADARSKE-3]